MSKIKHKLRQGDRILSLDHLSRCDWIILHGKPYNRGWVASWPLRLAKLYVDSGGVYEGIRLTNGQYYPNITIEKAASRFADELHRLSPCRSGGECPLGADCQDNHCWKSFNEWIAAPVK